MTWLGLMSGVSLLMYLFNLIPMTATGTLLNLAFNPVALQTTPFWVKLVSVGGVAVAGAAVASRFFNISGDQVLMWPILLVLAGFGWDFLVVYQQMAAQGAAASIVAVLIFGPLMLMYVISVIEWWRGVAP